MLFNDNCELAGVVTHTGVGGSNFVLCDSRREAGWCLDVIEGGGETVKGRSRWLRARLNHNRILSHMSIRHHRASSSIYSKVLFSLALIIPNPQRCSASRSSETHILLHHLNECISILSSSITSTSSTHTKSQPRMKHPLSHQPKNHTSSTTDKFPTSTKQHSPPSKPQRYPSHPAQHALLPSSVNSHLASVPRITLFFTPPPFLPPPPPSSPFFPDHRSLQTSRKKVQLRSKIALPGREGQRGEREKRRVVFFRA